VKAPAEELVGFGGWLMLIAIGQWLSTLGTLVDLLLQMPIYVGQWADPALRQGLIGEVGLDAGLVAFMLYTSIMMNMKRREFPTLFRIQVALLVLVPLLSTWWMSRSTGKAPEGLDFAATAAEAVFGLVGASLSILYSLRSERVRNTFIY
jgi:hypothetical protein